MSEPRYPSAREVAPRIIEQFRKLTEASAASGEQSVALVPAVDDLEAVIDAAFWASLRREETYLPRISLALLPPHHAGQPMRFERALPLGPVGLARVAPAVERPGIHLGIWRLDEALWVWGTTRSVPPSCIVLEVAAPGLLVIKHHRGDTGKYVNVAVLEADRIKMIDERTRALPDCPALVTALLGFDTPVMWQARSSVLVELAVSMRAHGRGGLMLVVPSGSSDWRSSIVPPITYSVHPPYRALAELVHRAKKEHTLREWQDEMEDAVGAIAGLTAVDGAAVLTDQFELLAFGAKIARRDGYPLVEQTSITEPIEGGEADVVHPSRLGGTRHLSAAQFVHDQHDALALVASQDGRFTIFAWSPAEAMVHAHRVETLLL